MIVLGRDLIFQAVLASLPHTQACTDNDDTIITLQKKINIEGIRQTETETEEREKEEGGDRQADRERERGGRDKREIGGMRGRKRGEGAR